jgi:hypothetical protein
MCAKTLLVLILFTSCKVCKCEKQYLITDICNIQQEIYEDLYLNLDNNSDSNILKVVNENLNYIIYCYDNNFQIDYNKLNKK